MKAALRVWLRPVRAARQIRLYREGLHDALDVMVKHMEREHPDQIPPPPRHLHVVR